MIISIASGKGGTGKTTVAVNLAQVAAALEKESIQFLDADVEEPNGHLFLRPNFNRTESVGIPVPRINQEKCVTCGICADRCAFNALAVLGETVLTFTELCHGCGGCSYFCPEGAITEITREIGSLERGSVQEMDYVHGRLNPGEAMSPPLIDAVKEQVNRAGIALVDAPPGTSCPVVSAVRGSDYVLLVTEPTPFGLNDLHLSVEMLKKLNLSFGVIINRADLGDSGLEDYCKENNITVLARIPWDEGMARFYARGEVAAKHSSDWKKIFKELWEEIKHQVEINEKSGKEVDAS